jgi:hypothetical protein
MLAAGPKHAVGAWLRLPRVPLTAADDQYLFELNVRLQYSDDEALLLPALEELGSIAAADFPAEALLQRQSLLVGCHSNWWLVASSREQGCHRTPALATKGPDLVQPAQHASPLPVAPGGHVWHPLCWWRYTCAAPVQQQFAALCCCFTLRVTTAVHCC